MEKYIFVNLRIVIQIYLKKLLFLCIFPFTKMLTENRRDKFYILVT